MVLVQLQVTTAGLPHDTRGPKDAVHVGAPPAMQVVEAEAVALAPSAATALMVQVSPAAPTL
jgi:hypothetical protein